MRRRRITRHAAAFSIAIASALGAGTGIAEASAPPPAFFGVVPQEPLGDQDLALMHDGRIGSLSVPVAWSAVEPGPETGYRWEALDATVAAAAARGVEILPYLESTPGWVAEGLDGRACQGSACARFAPGSPQALAAWAEFAAAAAERYGAGGSFWAEHSELAPLPVRAWRIWNGENSPRAYRPRPSPVAYSRLLAAAATSIRAQDPAAKVVVGTMGGPLRSGGVRSASAFLERLYRVRGARRHFDGVALQPIAAKPARVRARIAAVRRAMVAAGDGTAKLWVSIGFGSAAHGGPLNRGRAGQARSLRRIYRDLIEQRSRLHLRGIAWFSWADPLTARCGWCGSAGLLDRAGDPKPAWRALMRFTGSPCLYPERDCAAGTGVSPSGPDGFFGVTIQSPPGVADFARMAEGNLTTLRLTLPWSAVQSRWYLTPDFSLFDPIVLGAARRGIRTLPVLYGTPDWASAAEGGQPCSPRCEVVAPQTSAGIARWRWFVAAAALRYGPSGTLWGEHPGDDAAPDPRVAGLERTEFSGLSRPEPDRPPTGTPRRTSDQLRSIDPSAEVVRRDGGAPGAAGATLAWDFLRSSTRSTASGGFDHGPRTVRRHPRRSSRRRRAARRSSRPVTTQTWGGRGRRASSTGEHPLERGPEGEAELLAGRPVCSSASARTGTSGG